MLVYSGGDDSICSAPGTQEWIWDLGAEPTVVWKPWEVSGQAAGFVTLLDLGKGGASNSGTATGPSLTFATVHGAGHVVPAYRPMEALSMLARFLDGSW
jgi:carboxypeptidase C (cathepsin A)